VCGIRYCSTTFYIIADYAIARCPSVCTLSVTRRYRVEKAKRRQTFLPSLFHHASFFVPNVMAAFRQGVECFISEMIQDRGHSYYGTPIGTRMRSIECCYFQWPSVTCNPNFKVTPLYDAEYLRNGIRYNVNLQCNRVLHTPCSRVLFWMTFGDLKWLSEMFSDTKHARSLCDSWAFCYFVFGCLMFLYYISVCLSDQSVVVTYTVLCGLSNCH